MGEYSKKEQRKTHELHFTDGEVFEVPGVHGRMDRLAFDSGIELYRLEFEATEDCQLNLYPTTNEAWIGSAFHLQGHSTLVQSDGKQDKLDSENALLMRVDSIGQFHLSKGVLIRHVGVSMTMAGLQKYLGNTVVEKLDEFSVPFGRALVTKKITPSKKMQKIASSLFSVNATGQLRRMKLEGAALLFMAEILEQYCQEVSTKNSISMVEEQLFTTLSNKIKTNLAATVSIEQLADKYATTAYRLNVIFKQLAGLSFSDYIRNERLNTAHNLLITESLAIKTVALKTGYSHVGNFTRAYTRKFGESPSKTLRKL